MSKTSDIINSKILNKEIISNLDETEKVLSQNIDKAKIENINDKKITRIIRTEVNDQDFLLKLSKIENLPSSTPPRWLSKIKKIKLKEKQLSKRKRKKEWESRKSQICKKIKREENNVTKNQDEINTENYNKNISNDNDIQIIEKSLLFNYIINYSKTILIHHQIIIQLKLLILKNSLK
jgi:HD-GYP domain-containing protein (c-di-GMP phosphodiesterase class II)